MGFKSVESAGEIVFQLRVPAKLVDEQTGVEIDLATELPVSLVSRSDIDPSKLTPEQISQVALRAGSSLIVNAFLEGWRKRNEEKLRAIGEALANAASVNRL